MIQSVVSKNAFNSKSDNICADVEFGMLPDPESCRSFIVCMFFNPIPVNCSNEFPIFDQKSEECVAGESEYL